MWILVLKWGGCNMAMNFVACVIVIALVFIASSVWQTVQWKGLLFERKNMPKLSLLRKHNCLWHWNNSSRRGGTRKCCVNILMSMSSSAIRKRSNICTCLLPSHSSSLSDTPIPTRLYKIFDKAGESDACYQPGTLWCTRNADKTFASRTTLLQIVIFRGFRFLLDILGLHTSPFTQYTIKQMITLFPWEDQ